MMGHLENIDDETFGPFPLGLAYVLFVETNSFSELVVIFPDYSLRISFGTFSILLQVYRDITIVPISSFLHFTFLSLSVT